MWKIWSLGLTLGILLGAVATYILCEDNDGGWIRISCPEEEEEMESRGPF